jgi:predicted AAA+ superfamily ATPase
VAAATVQRDLLATLRDDFAKYASRAHRHRLIEVLASVPRQLGKKFVYAAVDRGERAASLEHAVELLCLARVCHRVRATTATGVPLAAGVDERFFKVVSLDTGLASVALGLDLAGLEATDVTLSNEGAIAEQAAAQLLRLSFSADHEPELFYWRRGERGSEAEVDHVMQHRTSIVPVEVKAGKTGTLKSLHALMSARRWKRAVRANIARPSVTRVRAKTTTGDEANYELLSIPLYLVEHLPRLLVERS